MDIKDALEQAYKNGYNDGLREFAAKLNERVREDIEYPFLPYINPDDVIEVEKELTKR